MTCVVNATSGHSPPGKETVTQEGRCPPKAGLDMFGKSLPHRVSIAGTNASPKTCKLYSEHLKMDGVQMLGSFKSASQGISVMWNGQRFRKSNPPPRPRRRDWWLRLRYSDITELTRMELLLRCTFCNFFSLISFTWCVRQSEIGPIYSSRTWL